MSKAKLLLAAKRGVWYHGSSIKNLRSILAQGLSPEVKMKNWDSDPDANIHNPSRESYGGIYVTRNLVTALGAPREGFKEGAVLLVIMELQPNTMYLDEDSIVHTLNAPLGRLSDHDFSVGCAYIAATHPENAAGWGESLKMYRQQYEEHVLAGLDYRMKERGKTMHPDMRERVIPLIQEAWLPALTRLAVHLFSRRESDYDFKRCWSQVVMHSGIEYDYARIPSAKSELPPVQQAEADYRNVVEQLTRTLKTLAAPGEREFNPTARVTTPVGYRGSNRILAVLEIRNGRAFRGGDHHKPMDIVVHYGSVASVPTDFIQQWKEREGYEINWMKPETKVAHKMARLENIDELAQYLSYNDATKGTILAETFPDEWHGFPAAIMPGADPQWDDNPSMAPDDILETFLYRYGRYLRSREPDECPACLFFEFKRRDPALWVVHFTNHALAIAQEGFAFGLPGLDSLALSTFIPKTDKRLGGYAFGFPAEESSGFIDKISREAGYGSQAIVCQADAVVAHHETDGYDQAIFWGKDARCITPVIQKEDKWAAVDKNGVVLFEAEQISLVVRWVKSGAKQGSGKRTRKANLLTTAGTPNLHKLARPTENKIELLKNQFKLTPEQVEQVIEADPSPNQTEYVGWLGKALSKKLVRLPEDTEKLRESLSEFTKLKRSPNFTGEKDIQKYAPADLYRTVRESGELKSKKETNRDTLLNGSDGAELIANRGNFKVYKVTDPGKAVLLSSNTSWCTAQKATASSYLAEGPLFFVYRSAKPYALLHVESEQFMDVDDGEIEYDAETEELFRILAPLIPWVTLFKNRKIARNPSTSPEVLSSLARDSDARVRWRVARNPGTPPAALTSLAGDADSYVRAGVAENPGTPPAVLTSLAVDADSYVRWRVAENPGTPPAVLTSLAGLQERGHDGVAVLNDDGGCQIYAVLSPSQIKVVDPDFQPGTHESSMKHADHFDDQGFWAGDGGGASGILPICSSTKRICLAWRSSEVQQGDCWGTLGGAVQKGMSPAESAKEEMGEETGYKGGVQLHPAHVFQSGSFKYHNFVGVVGEEFGFHPEHGSSWETDFIEWFTLAEVLAAIKEDPGEFHPGLITLFEQSKSLIEQHAGGEGPQGGKTAAAPPVQTMYHISRGRNRRGILAKGLIPQIKEFPNVERTPGVYLLETLAQAEDWAYWFGFCEPNPTKLDVWEVRLPSGTDVRADSETDMHDRYDSWIVYQTIPPENLSLVKTVGPKYRSGEHPPFAGKVDRITASAKQAAWPPLLTEPEKASLKAIEPRAGTRFRSWLKEYIGNDQDPSYEQVLDDEPLRLDYLRDWLESEHSIRVEDDGSCMFWKLTPQVEKLIGDLPVLLYHHTSSFVLDQVRKEGLHGNGPRANPYLNSGAGVYLTTEGSGSAVNGYLENARHGHRDEQDRQRLRYKGRTPKRLLDDPQGVTLMVKTYLRDLQPDPDDADVASVAGCQFIAPSVPPGDIVFPARKAAPESNKPKIHTEWKLRSGYEYGPDLDFDQLRVGDQLSLDGAGGEIVVVAPDSITIKDDTDGSTAEHTREDVARARLLVGRDKVVHRIKTAAQEPGVAVSDGLVDWRTPQKGLKVSVNALARGDRASADRLVDYLRTRYGIEPDAVDREKQVTVRWVPLESKWYEWGTSARGEESRQRVAAMVEAIKDGERFSPALTDENEWIDGNHRISAAQALNLESAPAIALREFHPAFDNPSEDARREEIERKQKERDRHLADELRRDLGGPEPVTASAAEPEAWLSPWIGVDLDGTLAEEIPGNDYSDPTLIGSPVALMVAKIQKALAMGMDVKVFTARMADKENAERIAKAIGDWTEEHIGTRLEATNEKTPGTIEIWDDKARRVEKGTGKFAQTVFHGTPHNLDHFSTKYVGSGEGSQVFGWGIYFAGNKDVATHYRKTTSDFAYSVDGVPIPNLDHIRKSVAQDICINGEVSAGIGARANGPEWLKAFESMRGKKVEEYRGGFTYEADIPEDDVMLDWDRPLDQQPEPVRAALIRDGVRPDTSEITQNEHGVYVVRINEQEREGFETRYDAEDYVKENTCGEGIYKGLAWKLRDKSGEQTSKHLHAIGIMGIKYLDAWSRQLGHGTSNYVVFDGVDVRNVRKVGTGNTKSAARKQSPINEDLIYLKDYLTMTPEQKEEEVARTFPETFVDWLEEEQIELPPMPKSEPTAADRSLPSKLPHGENGWDVIQVEGGLALKNGYGGIVAKGGDEAEVLANWQKIVADAYQARDRERAQREQDGTAMLEGLREFDDAAWGAIPKKVFTAFLASYEEHLMRNDPANMPSFMHMRFEKMLDNQWLIHKTDDPGGVCQKGFTVGMDDVRRLGLTTYYTDSGKRGGYNFAFSADDARPAERKYGKHAVMFQASGVEVFHYGDDENQVIFRGTEAHNLIPILNHDGDWTLPEGKDGEPVFQAGSLAEVVEWVEQNYAKVRKTIVKRATLSSMDPGTLGKAVKKFCHSDESFAILRSTSSNAQDGGWSDGGCWILAAAIQKQWGGELYALTQTGQEAQHVCVKIGEQFIDQDGAAPDAEFCRRFERWENFDIHALTLVPLNIVTVKQIPKPEKQDEIIAGIQKFLPQEKEAGMSKNPPGKPETVYPEGSQGWAAFPDQRGDNEEFPLEKLLPADYTSATKRSTVSALAQAVLATFDSNTPITWDMQGNETATASFSVTGSRVEVAFSQVSPDEWQVGFEVHAEGSPMDGVKSSIRIFSGVFQSVREFLEVRQPSKLVFASKNEALGELYAEYLKRQGTALAEMGYRMSTPVKASPLTEFTIEKTTPSAWKP